MRADRLDEFRISFESAVADSLPGGSPGPALYLDGRLAAREIDIELAESISRLEPFGEANEEPVWITSGIRLTDCRRVGDGKHLSCSLDMGSRRLGAVGFGMGDRQVPQGDLEAAYCLRVESYRGSRDLRLHLKDFRPVRTPAP
jgi:single-stranded-DNA-specific exonuclease